MFWKKKKKKKLVKMARKLVTIANDHSFISEQFRTIRTNITFSMPDREIKTILVTSATPGEGKSTNAANIGVVFAQEGKRVVIVDADLRKPTMHYTFLLQNARGLSNLLTRHFTISEVVNNTDIANLYVLTSGPIPPNPAELLASTLMGSVIEELKKEFDIIIFDAPPLLSVTDAQILSNKCDGTLLIVNSGVAENESVLKAKSSLEASKANILGVVLNNYKMPLHQYYEQYYR
ncbi:CpsD/CapB family tyrosine-protein kinase [Lysinibacillus capsici]|uniref:CpsD/CapB family tyrosine-protein kinase n=1 Tax=Lysinibacillus TaxID=400634 RepID=UPI0027318FCB|nr:CpsD/CapB family tyrosine-protein kinase [Lysinibacillus capsici]MDP1392996.1 CpsD/CapB family tyrosine-protein kinase [Lysinibacillus capsici]MDP1413470.1 CpsD/CapB family tyrosine-protein kinase [Lysinibacillus capsici]MDP1429593.1 CpsD/CapB family tyrosine-protein kinase [Lysinibacillus capsici]